MNDFSKNNSSKQRINLGCGRDIRAGWVNVDVSALPGVDVVHDLEQLPLPFSDTSVSEVLLNDVCEHIEYIPLLRDIHRILIPGGTVEIRVPHFTSKNSYTDPTHKKFFAIRTFDFFTTASVKGRGYYTDFAFSASVEHTITFERSSKIFFYNAAVAWLVNRSLRMQYLYESTWLSRAFPAENIIVTLQK